MSKIKQPKSEKQIEASKLYKQVIKLNTATLKRTYKYDGWDGRTYDRYVNVTVCKVNGLRYAVLSDLPDYTGKNFIENVKRKGILTGADFIHASSEGKIKIFVKVNSLLSLKDELYKYGSQHDFFNKDENDCFFSILEDCETSIPDNIVTPEELEASENAYSRRNQLITEAANESREADRIRKKEERENEEKQREIEHLRLLEAAKPAGDELKDLVARIEALGWEVTLRLKKHE